MDLFDSSQAIVHSDRAFLHGGILQLHQDWTETPGIFILKIVIQTWGEYGRPTYLIVWTVNIYIVDPY